MSKAMSPEELADHCQGAVDDLSDFLTELRSSSDPQIRKRAVLIPYAIRDRIRCWRREDDFSPQSVSRLKRGCVVRAEFGYRVRRELGGRHYAAVLDVDNSIYRDTVTIVPLSSAKPGRRSDRYMVDLGDDLYRQIRSNTDERIRQAQEDLRSARDQAAVERADQRMREMDDWAREAARMSTGSVAMVDQIMTISKQRISAPLSKDHPLYGVRLSGPDLDLIDRKIRELYSPSPRRERA